LGTWLERKHQRLGEAIFAKGSDFTSISEEQVQAVAARLNERPRKPLGFQTPNQVFFNSPTVTLRS
jgi:transposase, IS30 family